MPQYEGVSLTKLPVVKLMQNSVYHGITYWLRVHNYVDKTEGSILNV
jgi:hypothetical protein